MYEILILTHTHTHTLSLSLYLSLTFTLTLTLTLTLAHTPTKQINCEQLRDLLTTMGDRMTDEEVDEIMRGTHVTDDSFDYHAFVKLLKSGTKDEE